MGSKKLVYLLIEVVFKTESQKKTLSVEPVKDQKQKFSFPFAFGCYPKDDFSLYLL